MVNHPCPFEDCASTFNRPYRLRIHIQRHQGVKEFQCEQCDRGYHRRQHLLRHVAEAHQNRCRLEKPASCDHCERLFYTQWGLSRHRARVQARDDRTPAAVRRHGCGVCGKRFYTADDLERHNLRHERFKCTVPSCPLPACDFSWPSYHRHMTVYHAEPFECEHCGKRFAVKSRIRRHVMYHMPRIPCTVAGCDRTFTVFRYMVNHVRVKHGGKREFKCTVVGCDWEFKYKNCLNRHVAIHQKNGRIKSMADRSTKNKEPKFLMAKKLARLAVKV